MDEVSVVDGTFVEIDIFYLEGTPPFYATELIL